MYDNCLISSLRFPHKLWRIINECRNGAIRWSFSGGSILLDYRKFQEQYLDAGNSIFKTNNITSFIRQLNLYGFRKVTSHNRDPICNSHNPDIHEFLHENFRIGRPDLLSKIRRKTAGKAKYHRANIRRNINENNLPDTQNNSTSYLQMCRLELTRVLEEITREYQQGRYDKVDADDSWIIALGRHNRNITCVDFNFHRMREYSIRRSDII